MQDLDVKFTGRTPLVVHNIRLANPLDPYAKAIKAISSKRSKTEDDHLEMLRVEWEGGLYFDEELGPYVPVSYPTACLREAGAMHRQKTALKRGLLVMAEDGGERVPIEYEGPRTIEELWEIDGHRDVRLVRVNSARTMRSRPRFPEWELSFRCTLDETVIDLDAFERVLASAGRNIGIGEAPEGTRARFDSTLAVRGESEGAGVERVAA